MRLVLSLVERGGAIRSVVVDHPGIGPLFRRHSTANDHERADIALAGATGKRLAYETTVRKREPKPSYQLELPFGKQER